MLDKITLRKVASYDDVGILLEGLDKINIIYGGNGTGKTTISNYLSDMQEGKYAGCSCDWKNNDHERILVYNKKFREDTIINREDIPGVFTLGEGSSELLGEIKRLKETINEKEKGLLGLEKVLSSKRGELKTSEEEFRNKLWEKVYKENDDLDLAFEGYKKKVKLEEKLIEIFKTRLAEPKPMDSLKKKYDTLFSKKDHQKVDPLDESWFIDDYQDMETNSVWEETIIGKKDVNIAALVDRLEISDWVHQGKGIIDHTKDDICPFCQQHTITPNFRKQISDYFDENFAKRIRLAKQTQSVYSEKISHIKNKFDSLIRILADIREIDLDVDSLKADIFHWENIVQSNEDLMQEKGNEPSRVLSLKGSKEIFLQIYDKICKFNKTIAAYNKIIENKADEKKNLKDDIWIALCYAVKEDIKDKINKDKVVNKIITNLLKKISQKEKECEDLKKQLKEKQIKITSVEPTVIMINQMLAHFGFTSFKIISASDSGYQIKRTDGTIATSTLSEGEMTFLSFLYFMGLAQGGLKEEDVEYNRILVIDDPISSLDSEVLFVVSSLIKELFKKIRKSDSETNVKQVILLTHNIYFHKEVSYLDRRHENSTKFWILRKYQDITKCLCYDNVNPIKSSYELLWSELREAKENTIFIQNTMRRILETYFTVFGDYPYTDKVLNKMQNHEDIEIARSLLCWANDGSHGPEDDLYAPLPDSLFSKYKEVFKMIFEKLGHIGHYNMMMNIDSINH